jgi:transcriptional regulator with XRE-family HTH domain
MKKSKTGPAIQSTRGSGPVDRHIGGRIRALRNMNKMSQEELGDKLGVSFQQIQKYEKGVNRVSGGRLLQIAGALGCTVADLLDDAPANGKTVKYIQRDGTLSIAALDEVASDHIGIRLFKAYLGLPPNLRMAITQMAERLVPAAA